MCERGFAASSRRHGPPVAKFNRIASDVFARKGFLSSKSNSTGRRKLLNVALVQSRFRWFAVSKGRRISGLRRSERERLSSDPFFAVPPRFQQQGTDSKRGEMAADRSRADSQGTQ